MNSSLTKQVYKHRSVAEFAKSIDDQWLSHYSSVPLGGIAGDVFDGVFLCCLFFPRDVLDEIWDLIG